MLALAPSGALASSANQTFLLVAEAPNVGVAANGETIEITCESGEHVCGTFSVHPKSIEASGEFAHFLASGALFASGEWTATELISFQSYGCGEVGGEPIPSDLCGGVVKFAATFSTPIGELDGIITVFCIVGPKAASSHDEPPGEVSPSSSRASSTSTIPVAARTSTSRFPRRNAVGATFRALPPSHQSAT